MSDGRSHPARGIRAGSGGSLLAKASECRVLRFERSVAEIPNDILFPCSIACEQCDDGDLADDRVEVLFRVRDAVFAMRAVVPQVADRSFDVRDDEAQRLFGVLRLMLDGVAHRRVATGQFDGERVGGRGFDGLHGDSLWWRGLT